MTIETGTVLSVDAESIGVLVASDETLVTVRRADVIGVDRTLEARTPRLGASVDLHIGRDGSVVCYLGRE